MNETLPVGSVPDTDQDRIITLNELEKRYIVKALNRYNKNKTQTAAALGITIKTLYNKLHEYGLFEEYAKNVKS